MDRGAWWAAVHGVVKSWTRLSDFTFTFHFHALEKEMATHSSVLSWRIPGTGEPGGPPSMGSHRVGHDWSDLAAAASFIGNKGFPAGAVVKNMPANAGDVDLIPGWERSPGEEVATQFSILAWEIRGQRSLPDYSSWSHKESDTIKPEHTHTHTQATN